MKRVMLLSSFIVIMLLGIVAAASPNELFEQKTGVSPDDFKNPEQLKEEYLQKNWAEIIAKNKFIGPIHNFFLKISTVFKVLFGQPYSFSLTLLLVIVLWIVILKEAYLLLSVASPFNKLTNIVMALAISIILAQLQMLYFISNFVVQLIIAKEAWWMRLIAILVFVVIIFVINYGAKLGAQMVRKSKQQNEELTLKQKVAETAAFLKGIKKGQDAVKD
jgi:hypothetical protein